jgi:hypothetical protein
MLPTLLLLVACSSSPQEPVAERPPPDPGRPWHPNLIVLAPAGLPPTTLAPSTLPGFTGLAEHGCLFEGVRGHAAGPIPTLAELLSGAPALPPTDEQGREGWMDPGQPTLAETLGRYGYDRQAWWGETAAGEDDTLGRGFDGQHRGPDAGGEALLRWLESQARRPFLALLHDRDLAPASGPVDPTATAALTARVLAQLDARAMLDHTTVVLVSPPGAAHSPDQGRPVVPLLIAAPERPPCPQGGDARAIDLAPTLLSLAQAPGAHNLAGRDLLERSEP